MLYLVALATAPFSLALFLTVLAVVDTVMVAVWTIFSLGDDENGDRWFCNGVTGALETLP